MVVNILTQHEHCHTYKNTNIIFCCRKTCFNNFEAKLGSNVRFMLIV